MKRLEMGSTDGGHDKHYTLIVVDILGEACPFFSAIALLYEQTTHHVCLFSGSLIRMWLDLGGLKREGILLIGSYNLILFLRV
jgi:hypothetical protein